MGNSASNVAQSDNAHPPTRALHVLRVTPSSPASQTDIEPFFDYVIGVDGFEGIEVHDLEQIVESREGQELSLLIWSSKSNETRVVSLVPSREWAAAPSPDALHPQPLSHSRTSSTSSRQKPSLLGLSMRLCEPELALDNVWHILEVLEGSPAESAGLVPYGDWIVGWSGGVLRGENDFLEVVEAHVDRPLRVYVYSYDFDTLREVVLVPNRMWGGEGLLGCGVGFGLLHRIPRVRPGQGTLFDTADSESYNPQADYGSNGYDFPSEAKEDLFVPADDIYDDDEESTGIVESAPAQTDHHHTENHSHSHSHGPHHHQYPIPPELIPEADHDLKTPTASASKISHLDHPPRRGSPKLADPKRLVQTSPSLPSAVSNPPTDPSPPTSPSHPSPSPPTAVHTHSSSAEDVELPPSSPPVTQRTLTPNHTLRGFSGSWAARNLTPSSTFGPRIPRSSTPTLNNNTVPHVPSDAVSINSGGGGGGDDDEDENEETTEGEEERERATGNSITSVDD